MHSEILKPVVILIAWTLVMMLWMLATRLPAMKAAGIDMRRLVGTKPADADRGFRFALFLGASLMLVALTLHAAMAVFAWHSG